jgi:hypothetical protein
VTIDAQVQQAAEKLIEAMKLPVKPTSMELHFSDAGLLMKVQFSGLGWKRTLTGK